jgi:hypothetical protein
MQDLSYHISIAFSSPSIKTQALINYRVQGNFLDRNFVEKKKIQTYLLDEEICAMNINGSKNKSGKITCYAKLQLGVGMQQCNMLFLVTNLDKESVILGSAWL